MSLDLFLAITALIVIAHVLTLGVFLIWTKFAYNAALRMQKTIVREMNDDFDDFDLAMDEVPDLINFDPKNP